MLRHGWGGLRGVAGGTGRVSSSCGQGADLDEVVGEYSVSAPGSDSRQGGQLGAVPSVASFEVVDTTFTSGPPFDLGAEGFSVLVFPPCSSGRTGPRDGDVADPQVLQVSFDRGVPVAAICGDRGGDPPDPVGDRCDRRLQLRGIAGVSDLHAVVEDDP